MSKNTVSEYVHFFFCFFLRLQNKTLVSWLTHLNPPLSEAHVTENQSSTLHSNKNKQTCCSSNPVFPHDPCSQFSWWHAATGQWPPGPQWGLPYATQQGHLGSADPGSASGFITTSVSASEEGKARQQQLCQRRAALKLTQPNLSHQTLLFCFVNSKLYSASKTCSCDICEKPGVWIVSESWRTDGVSQRGFLLERIRLISLTFPEDACYQCLNSILKAEVDFLIF